MYDAPSLSLLKVDTFKGIDVSAPEDQIELYRAADALNMMPDASGEVRKRPGIVSVGGMGIPLGEGEKVVEVIGGDYAVTFVENQWEKGYRLFDKTVPLIFTDTKPVSQKYGNRWIFFIYNQ